MKRRRSRRPEIPATRAWSKRPYFSGLEYNNKGHETRATDPLGRETIYTYAANEIDLLSIKQKNGSNYDVLGSYTYNGEHEKLTETDPSGQTTTYTYTDGLLSTIVTPARAGITENRTTTLGWDTNGDGYLLTISGPATGATKTYTYDTYGRKATVTDPDGHTRTFEYDALDRVTKVTFPDGTYEQATYNRLDVEQYRDRLGRVTHSLYDALGRPVTVRDALGRTTTQQWCTCGTLDKQVDGNGNLTTWQRDVQSRVTQETRADSTSTTFVYENTTSRLKSTTDARGQTRTYSYALDDNPTAISYTNAVVATANVTLGYDPVYARRVSMTDGLGTTTFTYHPVASLGATALASVDGPFASDTVTYGYDELGRQVSRQVNGSANTQTRTYDVLGRLAGVIDPLGTYAWTYEGASPRIDTLTYPNSQISSYDWYGNTGDRRLQQIWHKRPDTTTIAKFDYTYDGVGRIATWTQQHGSGVAKTSTFGYDAAQQLASATIAGPTPAPVPSRFGYAYDKAGNRLAEQLDDAVTGATYNNRNQLVSQQPGGALIFRGSINEAARVSVGGINADVTPSNQFGASVPVPSGTGNVSVIATDYSGNAQTNTYQISQSGSTKSFTYDANGNLSSDGTRTFEWDAEDRLTRVLNGGSEVARFVYDGLGRRAQKVAGGITRTYVYDEEGLAEERLSSGGTIRYTHGPGLNEWIGRQNADSSGTYFVSDHLDSIANETNGAGQTTLTRTYDPWGKLDATSAATSGPAYTAREWDAEAGLYYLRARYYEPGLGRFISEDPIGGTQLYGYVENDPISQFDPNGLNAEATLCKSNALQCGKAYLCRNEAESATQSRFGYNRDHTPSNAFKHCYWMCCTTRRTSPGFALQLGVAHEGGAGKSSPSNRMDNHNNNIGICGAVNFPKKSCDQICGRVLKSQLRCDPCHGPRYNR